jgi:hypothetical protein
LASCIASTGKLLRCTLTLAAGYEELHALAIVYLTSDIWKMEISMASPGAPTSLDRHSKRVVIDGAEWRNRLEQLAEIRRAGTLSIPTDETIGGLEPGGETRVDVALSASGHPLQTRAPFSRGRKTKP